MLARPFKAVNLSFALRGRLSSVAGLGDNPCGWCVLVLLTLKGPIFVLDLESEDIFVRVLIKELFEV